VANLKAAGVEAEADVYPTNVHAFDMLCPEQETAKRASEKLLEQVGSALAQKA
jgi:acetyl esterase/lipase